MFTFSPSHGYMFLDVALGPIWCENALIGIVINDFKRIKSRTYMYADFCLKAIKFKRCLSYVFLSEISNGLSQNIRFC